MKGNELEVIMEFVIDGKVKTEEELSFEEFDAIRQQRLDEAMESIGCTRIQKDKRASA